MTDLQIEAEHRVSARTNCMKPSATVAMADVARHLRDQGQEIIDLAEGEPDFDTPPIIRDAAKAAIDAGKTRYTIVDGTAELKASIITKFRRDNGLDFAPEQISVGSGGKQVIFNALMATIDPGDEVIIPAPYWVSYPDIVAFAGGLPVFVDCPEENGFKLPSEALERVVSPRTRWLILNSPNNPTGAVYQRKHLESVAEVLRRHRHVMVLSDEIYEPITFTGRRAPSFAVAAPDLAERTLLVNGVSKAYAMTGWRIGYGAGPSWLIAAMRKIQSQSTTNPCSVSQATAAAALSGPQDFIAEWVRKYGERRDLVVNSLNAIDGLSCTVPEGAFYAFPNCGPLIGSITPGGTRLETDIDVARYLLEAAQVAVVPGTAFGMAPYLRIVYAAGEDTLRRAMDQIATALSALERPSGRD